MRKNSGWRFAKETVASSRRIFPSGIVRVDDLTGEGLSISRLIYAGGEIVSLAGWSDRAHRICRDALRPASVRLADGSGWRIRRSPSRERGRRLDKGFGLSAGRQAGVRPVLNAPIRWNTVALNEPRISLAAAQASRGGGHLPPRAGDQAQPCGSKPCAHPLRRESAESAAGPLSGKLNPLLLIVDEPTRVA